MAGQIYFNWAYWQSGLSRTYQGHGVLFHESADGWEGVQQSTLAPDAMIFLAFHRRPRM